MPHAFSTADLPDLRGKRAVITGANSGIGFAAAVALARRGARITLATRSEPRGRDAVTRLTAAVPGAAAEWRSLDLADLASVRGFGEAWDAPLDLLLNNAGVMALPKQETADGFEMQLGTNHLGHFALTGLLLPALLAVPGARVVTVSSTASYIGKIRFDDLDGDQSYSPWAAYGQSKLANLLFTEELDRRATAAGVDLLAAAAHPGYSSTNLQATSATSRSSRADQALFTILNRVVAQDADGGALPTLYAATSTKVRGGGFYGPRSIYLVRGGAGPSYAPRAAHDRTVAARLWEVSTERTGVDYYGPGRLPSPATAGSPG